MKFTKSKNFEKPDYVNEAMETLNFQAYGELESKRLYDVSVNTLREEK